MKQLIALLYLYSIALTLPAQTQISKTIPAVEIQSADFNFQRADVTFSTWDKNEILIEGVVSINLGEVDDAFSIDVNSRNGQVSIATSVELDNIPQGTFVTKNGKTIKVDKGNNSISNYDCITNGHFVEIDLTVKIPRNLAIDIESLYGRISIENIVSQVTVHNTYGSVEARVATENKLGDIDLKSTYAEVDLSLPKNTEASMELKTDYGQIYTDLDMNIKSNKSMKRSFMGEKIKSTLNGGGTKIKLESNYSNVYVRQT